MARHRSPGGRRTLAARPPAPRVGRAPAGARPGVSSLEATVVIPRAPTHVTHRSTPQPPVRGNTVVGATAALGAVVTGSLLAVGQGAVGQGATPSRDVTPLDLAVDAHTLAIHHAAPGHQAAPGRTSGHELDAASATLLPVAATRAAAADERDVEMLHKADKLATEAAAEHAAAAAMAAKQAFILKGGGELDDWISVALTKMKLPQSYATGIKKVIMRESKGNPKAINRWDSNALAGRPSQGLMQTIPSTFRAYVLPELAHLGITNPVANITAGVRYMIANYGKGTLHGGGRTSSSGRYIGY